MYYHKSWNLYRTAIFIVVTALFCAACGGKLNLGMLSGGSAGTGSSPEGKRLMQVVDYSYDYSAYPAVEGLTLVPMDTETQPAPVGTGDYRVRVEAQGKSRVAILSAGTQAPSQPEARIFTHFRFDPAQWQVEGVGHLNPWPQAPGFLPLVHLAEPGLLILVNQPQGLTGAQAPQGDFAKVFLKPAARFVSNYDLFQLSLTESEIGTVWYAFGENPLNDGEIKTGKTCLFTDGILGDDIEQAQVDLSKDGDIVTAGDLPASSLQLQDSQLEGWKDNLEYTGSTWHPITLSFTENLPGDYDNNGYVSINDITPLSPGSDWPMGDYYYSLRGTHQTEETAWFSTKAFLENRILGLVYPDDADGITINNFWFLDKGSTGAWSHPDYFVDYPALTPACNAVDGNWDGYVRDFLNWEYNPGHNGLDGKFDLLCDPDPRKCSYHPGDIAPISIHLNEALSGYQVWVVPTGCNPGSTGSVLIKTLYRGYDQNQHPSNEPYPFSLGGDNYLSVSRYGLYNADGTVIPDEPYDGVYSDPNEPLWDYDYMRKARIRILFNTAQSFFGLTQTNPPDSHYWGDYDIVVRPYYLHHEYNGNTPSGYTVIFGDTPIQSTRFSNVVQYHAPVVNSNDHYGPQYRPTTESAPFSCPPNNGGIVSIQQSSQPDCDPQFDLDVTVKAACDISVDENNVPIWDNTQVNYIVYAYYSLDYQSSTPPPANVIFESGHVLDTVGNIDYWSKNANGDISFTLRINKNDDYLKSKLLVAPLDQVGKRIWFGIRASEYAFIPPSPHIEYDAPGSLYQSPNTNIIPLDVLDRLSPYFFSSLTINDQKFPLTRQLTMYGEQEVITNWCSSVAFFPEPVLTTNIVINPAIDPPLHDSATGMYDTSIDLLYKLFIKDEQNNSVLLDSKCMSFQDGFRNKGEPKIVNDSPVLSFMISHDAYDNALQYDYTYRFAVVAYDGSNNPLDTTTTIYPRDSDFIDIKTPMQVDPPPVIQDDLSFSQGSVRGSILSDGNNTHLLFPQVWDASEAYSADLGYAVCPSGSAEPSLPIDNKILNQMPPIHVGAPFKIFSNQYNVVDEIYKSTTPQTSMAFQLDIHGNIVRKTNSTLANPLVSFIGYENSSLNDPFMLITAAKDSLGDWTPSYHLPLSVTGNMGRGASAPALHQFPFRRIWLIDRIVHTEFFGGYCLPWIKDDGLTWLVPLQIFANGDFRYRVRESQYGFWDDIEIPYAYSLDDPLDIVRNGRDDAYAGFGLETRATEIITRDSGLYNGTPRGDFLQYEAFGNMVCMLASSPSLSFDCGEYKWNAIDLNYSANPAESLHTVDLKSELDRMSPNGTHGNVPIGPNAMETTKTGANNCLNYIYVTYINSEAQNNYPEDSKGLRIAYAISDGKMITTPWSSPNLEGLIDSNYTLPGDRLDTTGTVSIVSLRKKPGVLSTESLEPFEGLGCAYIDARSSLCFAEYSNGAWSSSTLIPSGSIIDFGKILWVKLEYLNDNLPYIMYAIKTSTTNPPRYKIRLWSPTD